MWRCLRGRFGGWGVLGKGNSLEGNIFSDCPDG